MPSAKKRYTPTPGVGGNSVSFSSPLKGKGVFVLGPQASSPADVGLLGSWLNQTAEITRSAGEDACDPRTESLFQLGGLL